MDQPSRRLLRRTLIYHRQAVLWYIACYADVEDVMAAQRAVLRALGAEAEREAAPPSIPKLGVNGAVGSGGEAPC